MKLFAVVPAAGIGRRMGGELPKQYLELQGQAVIDWSIQALLAHSSVQQVVVALAQDDLYWDNTRSSIHPRVYRVRGGAERADSVLNALASLPDDPEAWVLVHDAARPCVREADIGRLIEHAGQGDGALLGVPLVDTVKQVNAHRQVEKTRNRQVLWRAFTPQLFPLNRLRSAVRAALQQGVAITDEASAMEWAGYTPQMVPCHDDNIKITRPGDLELAAFYLQNQRM